MTTAAPLALAPPRPQRTRVLRMMSDRIARRLLTIEEAAQLVGYSTKRLEDFIGEGSLPAVRLPSASEDPAHRGRRIPVGWLHRWFAMQDRGRPELTPRDALGGGPGEPLYISVAAAAAAIGLTPPTVYALIACGRFCAPIETPTGIMKINVDDLDDWLHALIVEAECEWYHIEEAPSSM